MKGLRNCLEDLTLLLDVHEPRESPSLYTLRQVPIQVKVDI
jgi:hypothetical protein